MTLPFAGTGSDAAKAADYAKENLDIYSFSLSASEVQQLNALKAPRAKDEGTRHITEQTAR